MVMQERINAIKKRQKRAKRTRKRIITSGMRPRLTVFRSNQYIYAQIVDDNKGKTLVSASEKDLKKESKMSRLQKAEEIGVIIAKKASSKKIESVVFDKGPYKYHGRIKALADGARKGGLIF
jgi:large subunit ribosomal protein L18